MKNGPQNEAPPPPEPDDRGSSAAPEPSAARRGMLRVLVAVVVGLIGSVAIWFASPYNTFVMRSQYIADSYLPISVLFLTLILVLGINPFLRLVALVITRVVPTLRPKLALTKWQLALVIGIMLVACAIPSSGMLRQLPYSIARVPLEVRDNRDLAKAYEKMNLPPSLFPAKIGYKEEVPAAEYYIRELPEGESIPWDAWLPPLLSWGTFMLFCWLMMIGLSLIVLPQWRRNERLPFPLLTVQNSLIEAPEPGRLLAPLFRKKSFWIAAGAVFTLHFLAGLKAYDPDSVPAIPLTWNLSSLFADTSLRHLPGHIRSARIYFILLGVTFFVPNRIGFSIWFFELAYGLYRVIGIEYFPPFHYGTIYEHRVGGMFTLTLFVLWLGRKHWAHVFRCIFHARNEEERKNRNAGIMFSGGCVGMYFWMTWAGVQPGWALFYVGIGFMVSLLITRIVAETGMPFIRIDFRYNISMVKLAPFSWLGPASLYFATVIAMLFPTASRVSCATMATHAIGLDEEAKPRHQTRLAWLLMLVLIAGFVIAGGVHVYANYHHGMSVDGVDQPLSPWGTRRISDKAHADLIRWNEGKVSRPVYSQFGHLCFGAALAAALEWACLTMPRWPFHPIGLLMNASYYANVAWASIMFGWLLKILLVKYGGARLYRAAKPLFLGIIMGEVFAAVYWSIEPVVRVLLDMPYTVVEVLPR